VVFVDALGRGAYRGPTAGAIFGSMTTSSVDRLSAGAGYGSRGALAHAVMFHNLRWPREMLAHLGPNWYASIMGTGIVANAAVTLPHQVTGLHIAATVIWIFASVMLVALTAAWSGHWRWHREAARGHARNPVMAQFYGAPPMALLTVGAGTLLLGRDLIGLTLALRIDAVLWALGTLTGLASALVIPYLMFTRHELRPESIFGGWLMPVVPPMVSAATGALLVPYAPPGQLQLTLLLGCYAMFGLSLMTSLIITTLIWYRLTMHNPGPATTVPTVWIVLGWLGQSITAVNLLGGVAHLALPGLYAAALQAFALIYSIPVLGFALLWTGLASAITLGTARQHLPFALTWWSFTFPVGTVVTGTSALATGTGSTAISWLAVAYYLALVMAWATVALRTARGSLTGRLFQAA
jgi:C4-dicarboxylate transporter/malic acid transport protein